MINRVIAKNINNILCNGKALIILGARQTGKTSMISEIFTNDKDTLFMSGDDPDVRTLFANINLVTLRSFLQNKKTLIIDEAQRIKNIGLSLKLIIDNIPELQVIATGSSSLDLSNEINEPLTGRKRQMQLYPISFQEMTEYHGLFNERKSLPLRLIYGSYPEVICNPGDEKTVLRELSNSYLYKDILAVDKIKKSANLTKLLQALAFQVGSQVSYNELSRLCGLDVKTVEKYISVLEQTYIIFRLPSLSRNARNELKNSRKIYFFDNGIRNSIIADFRMADQRQDIGALWENYLISERMKLLEYSGQWTNRYFWRTKAAQEIDYIEDSDGKLSAFEFKYNSNKKTKLTATFSSSYPDATFQIITPENYQEFLLPTT